MIFYFFLFLGLLFIIYLIFILGLHQALRNASTPDEIEPTSKNKKKGISIIIAFRNEAKVLCDCLESLKELNYPKDSFEVLLVNDFSDDNFQELLNPYLGFVKLLNSKEQGKKQAIEYGIGESQFPWILTTDADCTFNENWLQEINTLINREDSELFVLPVSIMAGNGLLTRYQYLESANTFAFNYAYYKKNNEILLASAANLLYSKEAFIRIEPYKNNRNVSSGDDIFLLRAFREKKVKMSIGIAKDLWVETKAMDNIVDMIDQRIRWISKMKKLKQEPSFYIGAIAGLIHFSLFTGLILGFVYPKAFAISIFFILVKAYIEMKMIGEAGNSKDVLPSFLDVFVFELLYLFTIPFLLILSIFRTPKWKGRKVSI